MALTETQRAILRAAADHPAGLASPPASLPPAPGAAVAKALLKVGLLAAAEPDDAADPALAWKLDGVQVLLAITDAGLVALAADAEPQSGLLATDQPTEPKPHEMTEADIEHELDLQQQVLDAEDVAAEAQAHAAPLSLRGAAVALLAAARPRGRELGGDGGHRPEQGPNPAEAAQATRETAERVAHRLVLGLDRLQTDGLVGHAAIACPLNGSGVPTATGSGSWTHTTVARVMARATAARASGALPDGQVSIPNEGLYGLPTCLGRGPRPNPRCAAWA